jgi:hypothetical protein
MIKLNRIGNKLGAVGLFGVLLSGGMVANQMISESTINSANHRAGVQQTIADHTLQANIALRGGAGGARYQAVKEPART